MKFIYSLFGAIQILFISSADPCLFGSRKRQKALNKLSNKIQGYATDTQNEIDLLKAENPFESAAAKSAMTQAARNAKQTQQRFANMMGANASPEAMVASQQATQEALAGTAGDIATGAEANKLAQLNALQNQKMGYQQMATGVKQNAISQKGSGWTSFFNSLNSIGSLAEGAGNLLTSL